MRRGNCYVTSEALYHLLGGKEAGWVPMRMKYEGDTHWFLHHTYTDQRIDATAYQFKNPPDESDYYKAVGCGFLTKQPSKRAKEMMGRLLWQPL